jgi:hypothetical protein
MDVLGLEEQGEGWGEGLSLHNWVFPGVNITCRKVGPSPRSPPQRGEEEKLR